MAPQTPAPAPEENDSGYDQPEEPEEPEQDSGYDGDD